jgi:hypothetical protein
LVVQRWTGSGDLPRWLHEPGWERPGWAGPRQNTDPWVFGDEFRYSNCRQGRNAKLRRLAQGSVILFGSSLGGAFVLDTVLVVADATPFVPGLARDLVGDDAYQVCVIEQLVSGRHVSAEFVLYGGASPDAQVNATFSFVPCRLADSAEPRFARPEIDLPEYINPRLRQQARVIEVDDVGARRVWQEVVDQVSAADLLLGTRFTTPPILASETTPAEPGDVCAPAPPTRMPSDAC